MPVDGRPGEFDEIGDVAAVVHPLIARAEDPPIVPGFVEPTEAAAHDPLLRLLRVRVPERAWTPAYDADGQPRDGAAVAELTGLLNLAGWPPGMRVIVRRERPHPGAQLRITDVDGNRITAFATNTRRGQHADLELRHRRRARCEDRIRIAKDTGLANLPLHDLDQNRIWCALVSLACELTAWMQMLAYPEHAARRWEPKRLRLRLLSAPGSLARHARRQRLHLPTRHPWTELILHLPHRDLVDGFTDILAKSRRLLAPGGVVAVTARPYRRAGLLVDIPGDVIRAGEAAGLILHERLVCLLAKVDGNRLIPRSSFFQLRTVRQARQAGNPLAVIAHEDLLIFEQPSLTAGSDKHRSPGGS